MRMVMCIKVKDQRSNNTFVQILRCFAKLVYRNYFQFPMNSLPSPSIYPSRLSIFISSYSDMVTFSAAYYDLEQEVQSIINFWGTYLNPLNNKLDRNLIYCDQRMRYNFQQLNSTLCIANMKSNQNQYSLDILLEFTQCISIYLQTKRANRSKFHTIINELPENRFYLNGRLINEKKPLNYIKMIILQLNRLGNIFFSLFQNINIFNITCTQPQLISPQLTLLIIQCL